MMSKVSHLTFVLLKERPRLRVAMGMRIDTLASDPCAANG